jgi:hypothetical protein
VRDNTQTTERGKRLKGEKNRQTGAQASGAIDFKLRELASDKQRRKTKTKTTRRA